MKYEVSYDFIMGESKIVGGTISSKDGSGFLLTSTYKYCDRLGNLLDQGTSSIDGNKVFILLSPTLIQDFQFVEFTITITPILSDGTIDSSKSPEKFIEKVFINVESD